MSKGNNHLKIKDMKSQFIECFVELTEEELERSSMKMQELVKALKTFTPEEVKKIRSTKSLPPYFAKLEIKEFTADMLTVLNASESDFNHAIATFKI
jgi:hypothetical protein|nr:MAG TPA: hypothetical protein [Caudoviricetes sp.]